MIRVEETTLPGVKLVHTRIFADDRGSFRELWHGRGYADAGLPDAFVQDNVSISRGGVIRGLHFQHPNGQAKLVSVLDGEIWDVAVDVRRGSPTFGEWYGATLSSSSGKQLYIPEGFAHGFAVTSERAVVSYKCTAFFEPASERTLLWNDPAIGIDWPMGEPVLSEKDREGVRLGGLNRTIMPEYEGTTA